VCHLACHTVPRLDPTSPHACPVGWGSRRGVQYRRWGKTWEYTSFFFRRARRPTPTPPTSVHAPRRCAHRCSSTSAIRSRCVQERRVLIASYNPLARLVRRADCRAVRAAFTNIKSTTRTERHDHGQDEALVPAPALPSTTWYVVGHVARTGSAYGRERHRLRTLSEVVQLPCPMLRQLHDQTACRQRVVPANRSQVRP
jgi:hypothetical protein